MYFLIFLLCHVVLAIELMARLRIFFHLLETPLIEYRVRCSASLGTGRSGVQTPVETRFSGRIQTGLETHPRSCTTDIGFLSQASCRRGVAMATHPILAPWLGMLGGVLLHPNVTERFF